VCYSCIVRGSGMQTLGFFIAFVLAFVSACYLINAFLEVRYGDKLSLSPEHLRNAVYRRLVYSLLYGAGAALVFVWTWHG
jgi:hypothetical protein